MSNEKESFEDWWELFELHCVSSDETIKVIEIVESAWNHQAKKLEEKEQRLESERKSSRHLMEQLNEERLRSGSFEKRIKELERNCFIYARDYKRGDNKKIFSRSCISKGIEKYESKIKSLEKQNAELREVLESYATMPDGEWLCKTDNVIYDRMWADAKEALAKIEKGEE